MPKPRGAAVVFVIVAVIAVAVVIAVVADLSSGVSAAGAASTSFGSIRPSTSSSMRISSGSTLVGHFEDVGNRRRAGGNCLHHVLEAILDALGDLDFAFAGEQFDRAHFTHVHAHRVGGAAEFGVDSGQGLFGLFLDLFVIGRAGRGVRHQQIFGSRGFVEDLDAHVVEGGDDGLDAARHRRHRPAGGR